MLFRSQTHALDALPALDRRRQHRVEVVVDRIVVQPTQRSRLADSIENTLALGRGVLHVALVQEQVPESRWEVIVHSQHLACDRCGRSFEPLTPHSFSFNTPLGWCTTCEGLGTQTGANLAALIRDPKLTLAQGGIDLWPDLAKPVSRAMLDAFARQSGIPLDTPFHDLSARHRRLLLHGTGEQWFDVSDSGSSKDTAKPDHAKAGGAKQGSGLKFRFQFKGLYPALEEASRITPALRGRLESFVGEVECSTCSGSRLRSDAGAARFRGQTIDEICRMPLGELQRTIERWSLTSRDQIGRAHV